jgi:2-keto-4-pentenoate hydratase/2-oxohepta-3-ene-1,7-dioic acid hydratase in catechol pathway
MRLYAHQDRRGEDRIGALVDEGLLTAGRLRRHERRPSMLTWQSVCCIVNVDGWRADLETTVRRAVRKGAKRIDPERRRPLPAVQHPGKIVCVGLNYGDHVAEGGRPAPDRPLLFAKFGNAIIGDGEAIVRPPGTHALDLEVELGVVIGRRARRVSEEDALAYVAGYVVTNDVSARDWQGTPQALHEGEKGDGQWLRAKGSDTFLPIGPTVLTPDEVDPAAGLAIRSWRIPGRGEGAGVPVLMQDGNTADMLFSVPSLISYISRQITLDPGDLVITGTPAGVGVFRDPPVFLVPGDRVRCEIEGIGVVENPVVDWTDDPRRDA